MNIENQYVKPIINNKLSKIYLNISDENFIKNYNEIYDKYSDKIIHKKVTDKYPVIITDQSRVYKSRQRIDYKQIPQGNFHVYLEYKMFYRNNHISIYSTTIKFLKSR